MLIRKGIGALCAAGAIAAATGLAGCAATPAGTGYASGSGPDYVAAGDYWPDYDAGGAWLGGVYGGGYGWWGGHDRDRHHGDVADAGRGGVAAHDGWRGGVMHTAAAPGGFFGGAGHLSGGHFATFAGGHFGGFGGGHFGGGFGGGGHR